ncbi:unnamed protein product [Rodentolepis nana]|uniref:Secreted protein n=1 Tax=Rodentolepis nana TaxID=102285 RepID=A0A0R3U0M9_RODNA|nr:unnamed protein product [Rodentolepis nana]
MSMLKIFLLFGLVGVIFARHIGHHEGHEHNDDHHHEEDEDDLDETYLIPARTNYGGRRTVIWTGPSSYSGYRSYQKTPTQTQQRSTYPRQTNYYPRQSPYVSRETYYPQSRSQARPIKAPLYNKQRAGDEKYKQGLRELADLMV